ncbi:MAG: hypothetical protein JXB17_12125 [Bacteroidales bacterium]|nr:hypothetical protein [Bacteroidales bacterium]
MKKLTILLCAYLICTMAYTQKYTAEYGPAFEQINNQYEKLFQYDYLCLSVNEISIGNKHPEFLKNSNKILALIEVCAINTSEKYLIGIFNEFDTESKLVIDKIPVLKQRRIIGDHLKIKIKLLSIDKKNQTLLEVVDELGSGIPMPVINENCPKAKYFKELLNILESKIDGEKIEFTIKFKVASGEAEFQDLYKQYYNLLIDTKYILLEDSSKIKGIDVITDNRNIKYAQIKDFADFNKLSNEEWIEIGINKSSPVSFSCKPFFKLYKDILMDFEESNPCFKKIDINIDNAIEFIKTDDKISCLDKEAQMHFIGMLRLYEKYIQVRQTEIVKAGSEANVIQVYLYSLQEDLLKLLRQENFLSKNNISIILPKLYDLEQSIIYNDCLKDILIYLDNRRKIQALEFELNDKLDDLLKEINK